MHNQKKPTNLDLIGADAALRRAAISAKKLAEQLGTPYVVYTPDDKSANKSTNAGEEK
ncbi:MAG: hypothetical protein RIS87_1098 [Pseudomonadota bacterium]|jgi:hypothetical protein